MNEMIMPLNIKAYRDLLATLFNLGYSETNKIYPKNYLIDKGYETFKEKTVLIVNTIQKNFYLTSLEMINKDLRNYTPIWDNKYKRYFMTKYVTKKINVSDFMLTKEYNQFLKGLIIEIIINSKYINSKYIKEENYQTLLEDMIDFISFKGE